MCRNNGRVGKLGPAAAVLGQELPQLPTPLQRHHRQSDENVALHVHWLRGLRRAVQVVRRANDVKRIDISRCMYVCVINSIIYRQCI